MRILADAQIAHVADAFAEFGRVELFTDAPAAAALRVSDVLLVRTLTRVDAALLEGSRIRFVGSATAGIDHVDEAYLDAAGIGFAWASGCNADAVVDYVLSAMARYALASDTPLADLRVGVVGCGQVGGRLLARLRALGCPCMVNDPPLAERGAGEFAPLAELLSGCQVVSLHVPLTDSGPHATRGLLDARRLALLAQGSLLINAARGGVVDERALSLHAHGLRVVLDCWENEPDVGAALRGQVFVATPHIAGYSQRGKDRATAQLHTALSRHLGAAPVWQPAQRPGFALQGVPDSIEGMILAGYDVCQDARLLAQAVERARSPADGFRAARDHYVLRPELGEFTVNLQDPTLRKQAAAAGLRVQPQLTVVAHG